MASIYEAAVALGSRFASITVPQAPDEIRVLPPGHDDDRHAKRDAVLWVNIVPGEQSHEDEVNSSSIYTYQLAFSAWYARGHQTLEAMAQNLGSLGQSCVAAVMHSTLGGFARKGISAGDISISYETGGQVDLAYVVRGTITVERQQ